MSKPTTEEEKSKMLRELGEPVMADMPEELRRTKRNFLALATFVIFYQWSGISISKAAPLGIEISTINPKWILWTFLAIGLYTSIQFTWLLFNYYLEVRIRVTGEKRPYTTNKDAADFWGPTIISPSDSRQASLHFWWANMLIALPTGTEIEALRDKLKETYDEKTTPGAQKELTNTIDDLNKTLTPIKKELSSQHIQISLDRYENGFNNFSRSQRWRFYLLDTAVPILLGLLALGWTLASIFMTSL